MVVRVLALGFAARPPPFEELAQLGLPALRARSVVHAGLHLGGPVLLRNPSRRRVVRVHVTLPVTELAGARVTGVPQVHRHGSRGAVAHVLDRGADPRDHGVRLRRQREVDDGLGEVETRFGHADELDGAGGGVGHEQRLRVGHADVLGGQDHEAARHETWVLPRFQHARQPVQPRIRIRPADALDERGQDVVVLVVAVPHGAQRQRRFGVGERHILTVLLGGQRAGDLERREGVAGVAFRPVGQVVERVGVDGELGVAEAALGVGERALEQRPDVVGLERIEPEERRSRQERSSQGEVRVLRRRADQYDQAFLDVWQQRVLLGAVEAVHLVEEEDRALAVLAEAIAGAGDDLAHVLDARAHRRQRFERLGGDAGDEPGDRCLARAGRSPQHDRRQAVALDQDPQRTSRPEQVLLPDDLVEGARPQPRRQRRALVQPLVARRSEQILAHGTMVRVRRVSAAAEPADPAR